MKKSVLTLIVIVSFILCSFSQSDTVVAGPNTIVVPDDFGSIQEAIDFAVGGDTVYVKSGTYHENLVVNKSLSLVGENVDNTIVDGNPPEGYRIPVKVQCDNVSVSGFKLLYGYTGISVGDANYCSISGNRIAGNEHGIVLVGCSYCNVTKNYCELIGLSSAIQLSYSNYNLISGNYIDKCTEGIQVWQGSANNTVTENTVTNCDDVAIRLQYADNNTIARNDVSNSGLGTTIYVANNNTITENNYKNNIEQFPSGEWEWYAKTFGYNGSYNVINQNYWSDYNGTDANGDGLGDTAYILNEDNQDNKPIMAPITVGVIPEFSLSTVFVVLLAFVLVVAVVYRRVLNKFGGGK